MNKFFEFIISYSKYYGFIFPSSEIYSGIQSIYDYGQYGLSLKNNIKEYWWKSMTQLHDNIVGIDTAILMNYKVWKSSGHIDLFNELYIDNKDSKKRYRPEVLIKEYIDKNISDKEKNNILYRLNKSIKENKLYDIDNIIRELGICDPVSKTKNWTKVRFVNMMFKINNKSNEYDLFLRPEIAQGAFCNFKNIVNSNNMKIPFGIAQVGKSFRNELIARQFLFRMKEFEQMEMQFFILPKEEKKWYEYWKNFRLKWHLILNLGKEKYKLFIHKNLAHYASLGTDIQFDFPFGYKELEGIHSRKDFDLKKHEFFSNKKFSIFSRKLNYHYIPYVIETSIGLDRMFFAILSASLKKECFLNKKNKSDKRIVLKINPCLSPIKAAIFPLVKNNDISNVAKKIFNDLKIKYPLIFEENKYIGKLYRKQDAIGTPLCFTVDYNTIENDILTVRYRDSMKQKKIYIREISNIIDKETNITKLLSKISI